VFKTVSAVVAAVVHVVHNSFFLVNGSSATQVLNTFPE